MVNVLLIEKHIIFKGRKYNAAAKKELSDEQFLEKIIEQIVKDEIGEIKFNLERVVNWQEQEITRLRTEIMKKSEKKKSKWWNIFGI